MSTVTVKGQVTIPKPIRDLLGVGPGSRVEFAMDDAGQIVVRKADTEGTRRIVSRFSQFLGTVKCGMTTDQIMALTRGDD